MYALQARWKGRGRERGVRPPDFGLALIARPPDFWPPGITPPRFSDLAKCMYLVVGI